MNSIFCIFVVFLILLRPFLFISNFLLLYTCCYLMFYPHDIRNGFIVYEKRMQVSLTINIHVIILTNPQM